MLQSSFQQTCVLLYAIIKYRFIPVRVATDVENLEKSGDLKETSESQGICAEFQKSGNFVV